MRVLLAWELGGGFGHVAPMRALALDLRRRGHECVFAVRQPESAAHYLDPRLGPMLQAPLRPAPGARAVRVQVSYASLLYSCGFDSVGGLSARLRAWRDLLRTARCEALIGDHSPTALLAARSLALPVAAIGTGFSLPPSIERPFPCFRTDLGVTESLLIANDAAVLRIANAALSSFGTPPLESIQDLFERAFGGLFTYAEFDHYHSLRTTPYRGLPEFSLGADINWGPRREPRVFAYLRPFPGLKPLLQALRALPAQVLVRIAEADPESLNEFRRDGLVIVDQDVDIRRAAADCDAFINYAAHGTVLEMLLAGKPGLLIPRTREQSLIAQRAEALGAVQIASAEAQAGYAQALARLLDDTALRRAAEDFAGRYTGQRRDLILPAWCEEFLEFAAGAGAPSV